MINDVEWKLKLYLSLLKRVGLSHANMPNILNLVVNDESDL